MNQPMIKNLEINVSKGRIEQTINAKILNDFNDFKTKNELIYCTMHQEKPKGNSIDVSFSATVKYKDRLLNSERLLHDFNVFQSYNEEDYCQITKTSHQDSTLIAEFTVFRTYQLNFTQE